MIHPENYIMSEYKGLDSNRMADADYWEALKEGGKKFDAYDEFYDPSLNTEFQYFRKPAGTPYFTDYGIPYTFDWQNILTKPVKPLYDLSGFEDRERYAIDPIEGMKKHWRKMGWERFQPQNYMYPVLMRPVTEEENNGASGIYDSRDRTISLASNKPRFSPYTSLAGDTLGHELWHDLLRPEYNPLYWEVRPGPWIDKQKGSRDDAWDKWIQEHEDDVSGRITESRYGEIANSGLINPLKHDRKTIRDEEFYADTLAAYNFPTDYPKQYRDMLKNLGKKGKKNTYVKYAKKLKSYGSDSKKLIEQAKRRINVFRKKRES